MTDLLTVKLVVSDADAAIAYYENVFGARLLQRHAAGATVSFAQLAIFDTTISVKDVDGFDSAPGPDRPGTIIEVTTADPDAIASRMTSAGGSVIFAVADQDYGARAGRFRDPFGHQWLLSTPIPPTQG